MKWGELLRPNLSKILGVILLIFLLKVLPVLYVVYSHPGAEIISRRVLGGVAYSLDEPGLFRGNFAVFTVFGILWDLIIYYPFVCVLWALNRARKERNLGSAFKERKVLYVLVFLNPLAIKIYFAFLFLLTILLSISASPELSCGVVVTEVHPGSMAEGLGWAKGTIIVGINHYPIRNASEFQKIVETIELGKENYINWHQGARYSSSNIVFDKPLGVEVETYITRKGSWECGTVSDSEKYPVHGVWHRVTSCYGDRFTVTVQNYRTNDFGPVTVNANSADDMQTCVIENIPPKSAGSCTITKKSQDQYRIELRYSGLVFSSTECPGESPPPETLVPVKCSGVDECFNLAWRYRDPSICYNIENESSDNCAAMYYMSIRDIGVCDSFNSAERIDFCLKTIALAEGREEYCEKITDAETKSRCLLNFVDNIEDCDYIPSSVFRISCYLKLAQTEGNVSICTEITPPVEEGLNLVTACCANIQDIELSKECCRNIGNSDWKTTCNERISKRPDYR